MQISSSSSTLQTQPSSTSAVTLPVESKPISDISDKYQQLSPEQQRNVDIRVDEGVSAYQNQAQMKRDFQRNASLSVNNYQHQQSLQDIYISSSSDEAKQSTASSSSSSNPLEHINTTIENGQQVQRQLAVAEFYHRYGGGSEVTQPVDPADPVAPTPYAASVSVSV